MPRAILGFLFGLTFSIVVPNALAQDVRGIVRKMDLATGVVVVQPVNQENERELSLLNKDVPVINLLGQPVKLTEVPLNIGATFKITDDYVTAIRLEGPAVWGVLRAVDPVKRTIQVEDPVRNHLFTLPRETPVFLHGKMSSLDAFKPAIPAQVILGLDQKTILQVKAGNGVLNRDPFRRFLATRAVVLEIAAAERKLRSVVQSTSVPLFEQTFTVSPDASVQLVFKYRHIMDLSFEELRAPLQTVLTIDEVTKRVEGIEVEVPYYLRSRVVSYDSEKRLLAIEVSKEITKVEMTKDFKVLTARGEGKIEDIKPGRIVNVGVHPKRDRGLFVMVLDR